jgi:ferredoxin
MSAKLSRRHFLRLAASGAIGVAAAACAPKAVTQTPTPAAPNPTLESAMPFQTPTQKSTLQAVVQLRPVPKGTRSYTTGCDQGGHVITRLCLRCNACAEVCPVECIVAGEPVDEWPLYYVDPDTCIDCGACVPECPWEAIFPAADVPASYASEGMRLNMPAGIPGFDEVYDALNGKGEPVHLEHTRVLKAGEMVDLRPDCRENARFFMDGPGYAAIG